MVVLVPSMDDFLWFGVRMDFTGQSSYGWILRQMDKLEREVQVVVIYLQGS